MTEDLNSNLTAETIKYLILCCEDYRLTLEENMPPKGSRISKIMSWSSEITEVDCNLRDLEECIGQFKKRSLINYANLFEKTFPRGE